LGLKKLFKKKWTIAQLSILLFGSKLFPILKSIPSQKNKSQVKKTFGSGKTFQKKMDHRSTIGFIFWVPHFQKKTSFAT